MTKADRRRLEDRLHLLADGDPAECSNAFSINALSPIAFAALWCEHGADIIERWAATGHQPSKWWLGMARRAGVRLPGRAA
jgi:hypothetical protein